ncbi:MAG: hypothetical protein MZW92_79155 [Comamonadaceae bacterium]|nr:hypothetical protein [Comamonadaceae bacterium]
MARGGYAGAAEDPRARRCRRRRTVIAEVKKSRAARPRRRGLPDRPEVELHAARSSRATSTSSATPTRASRAPSRTATSCATTRTR